jgi:hypothetical protein
MLDLKPKNATNVSLNELSFSHPNVFNEDNIFGDLGFSLTTLGYKSLWGKNSLMLR